MLAAFLRLSCAGEHARFPVVDQQEIPAANGSQQLFPEILDPEVHGVAAGQANILHLRTDAGLQARLDVAHQQIRRVQIAGWKFGIEVGEHVQVRLKRFAIVHIRRVLAGPEKSLAGDALQTFQIHAVAGQQIRVLFREIVPDHGDDADLGEIARGQGNVCGRPA